jgi:DeoR family fructose operon transcriptional repressor
MPKHNKSQSRHKVIMALLEQNEEITLPFLCQKLNCSETTIRNDLRSLEQHGMLRRTFGGAIRVEENTHFWLNINMRERAHALEKNSIARYAADHYVRPDMTIFLDAGTTCALLAQEIAKRRIRLTVMTYSFHAAVALAPSLDLIQLYLIGGMYNPITGSLYDEFQQETFKHLRADVFFMGTDAVSGEGGLTITGLSGFAESASKRALIDSSEKTYALADHYKFGRTAMKLVCDADAVDAIITDDGVDAADVKELSDRGAVILTAETGSGAKGTKV